MPCWMLLCIYTEQCGIDGQATIIDCYESSGDDSTSYNVKFAFRVGAIHYEKAQSVSSGTYRALAAGDAVGIKYLAVNPAMTVRLRDPRVSSPGPFMWLLFVFWDVIMIPVANFLVIQPLRAARIGKLGRAVEGQILARRELGDSESRMLEVSYRFFPRGTTAVNGKAYVNEQDYGDAEPGVRVTVLFLPEKPACNLIYDYADFVVA